MATQNRYVRRRVCRLLFWFFGGETLLLRKGSAAGTARRLASRENERDNEVVG